ESGPPSRPWRFDGTYFAGELPSCLERRSWSTDCPDELVGSVVWRGPVVALPKASDGWCGRGDSNPHELAPASPSSWCVCQFRHFRVRWEAGRRDWHCATPWPAEPRNYSRSRGLLRRTARALREAVTASAVPRWPQVPPAPSAPRPASPPRAASRRAPAPRARPGPPRAPAATTAWARSEEHTSELHSRENIVC